MLILNGYLMTIHIVLLELFLVNRDIFLIFQKQINNHYISLHFHRCILYYKKNNIWSQFGKKPVSQREGLQRTRGWLKKGVLKCLDTLMCKPLPVNCKM